MNKAKQIGVWMDHSIAKIIQLNGEIHEIESNFESHLREPGESGSGTKLGNFRSTNNEVHKHNKENNELHSFFNNVYEELKPFDEILMFGPSTAQSEFHNYILNKNKKLNGKIQIFKTDYLTDNQLVEYVKNHFVGKKAIS